MNGKTYSTGVGTRGIYIDKMNNDVYGGNQSLYKYSNAYVEANASEASSVRIGISGGAGCNEDGTLASAACVNVYHGNSYGHVYVGYSSNVYFLDVGPRVRFISNSNDKIYTALGSKALYGEGLNKQFLRSTAISGIYYKKASEPNQGLFPEGLYFTDKESMTVNHIHPSTGIVSVVAGNQSLLSVSPPGSLFNSSISLGPQHYSINLLGLDFDSNGLPWFVLNQALATVNASNQIALKQTGAGVWSLALQNNNPASFKSLYRMTSGNLAVSGDGTFVIGNTNTPLTKGAVIQYHNYGASLVQHLMGGAVLPTEGFSPDSATPGSTAALTLTSSCNTINCFAKYDAANDILYFSEVNNIRFITSPKNASLSTLGTLFDAGRAVRNFIFSENGEQVYYVGGDQLLYCYDLPGNSSPSHCDNTSLGPNAGFKTIIPEANQLTWKSATELLINNGQGEIYVYKTPP
jgi:hypothetical protein